MNIMRITGAERKFLIFVLIVAMVIGIISLAACGSDVKGMNINEIDDLIGEINLIDVREPHEYAAGTIRTAVNIPMNTLLANPDDYLDKNQTYYIMCQSGVRSKKTSTQLAKQGFDVINLVGGYGSYKGENKE